MTASCTTPEVALVANENLAPDHLDTPRAVQLSVLAAVPWVLRAAEPKEEATGDARGRGGVDDDLRRDASVRQRRRRVVEPGTSEGELRQAVIPERVPRRLSELGYRRLRRDGEGQERPLATVAEEDRDRVPHSVPVRGYRAAAGEPAVRWCGRAACLCGCGCAAAVAAAQHQDTQELRAGLRPRTLR